MQPLALAMILAGCPLLRCRGNDRLHDLVAERRPDLKLPEDLDEIDELASGATERGEVTRKKRKQDTHRCGVPAPKSGGSP